MARPRRKPGEYGPIELHARGPRTSHRAIKSYDKLKLSESMRLLQQIYRERPDGLIDEEEKDLFMARVGRPCHISLHQQVRNQLRDRGWIKDSGTERVNPVSGEDQIVWVQCDEPPLAKMTCPTCGAIKRVRPGKPPKWGGGVPVDPTEVEEDELDEGEEE